MFEGRLIHRVVIKENVSIDGLHDIRVLKKPEHMRYSKSLVSFHSFHDIS